MNSSILETALTVEPQQFNEIARNMRNNGIKFRTAKTCNGFNLQFLQIPHDFIFPLESGNFEIFLETSEPSSSSEEVATKIEAYEDENNDSSDSVRTYLKTQSLTQLKSLAKDLSIKGRSKMSSEELIEALIVAGYCPS